MLIAQEAATEVVVSADTSMLQLIFLFVSFLVVANLVSKHLAMKHERALKFGEAHKGSWLNRTVLILLLLAVAPALLFFWVSGGMPRLSTHETVFAFVAFVIAANLISKHFTMKHELALKHEKAQRPPVPQKHQQENTPMFYGVKIGILSTLFALIPLAAILLWFINSPPANIAGYGIPNAPNVSTPVPVSPTPLAAPPNGMAESTHGSGPDSISNWTEDLPFDANQYPSIAACAAPLARQIVEEIEASRESKMTAEATTSKKGPTPLRLSQSGFPDQDFSDFTKALKVAFKSLKPTVFVAEGEVDNARLVSFSLKNLETATKSFYAANIPYRTGDISFRWSQREGNVVDFSEEVDSVSFIETPWLTDFQQFTSLHPQNRFFIGASTRVQSLKSKAHQAAVQDIANRLNLRAEQIEPRIFDRFTQTIERPYGKVYREAILVVDPPTPRLARNSVGVNMMANRTIVSGANTEFLLAMMVCLTVVAGFVSNIATQGYYRTEISKTVWAIAGIVAFVIFLFVIVHIFA